MHYLTSTLPTLLAAFGSSQSSPPAQPAVNGGMNYTASSAGSSSSTNGQQALIQVYAVLPFGVFKSVIESADFPPGDMERVRLTLHHLALANRCLPTHSSHSLNDASTNAKDEEGRTANKKRLYWHLDHMGTQHRTSKSCLDQRRATSYGKSKADMLVQVEKEKTMHFGHLL